MSIKLFINDLPDDVNLIGDIAIDTEAMGLKIKRDRLCLVQMCDEKGNIVMVHYPYNNYDYTSPNLKKLLSDESRQKIFHFARFDVAIMNHYLNIDIKNIFCTKIASKLCRTYTEHHGLKTIVNELIGFELKKEQQSSNWGAKVLTEAQKTYAKNDVIYLHQLREKLITMLYASGRLDLAQKYFDFLPTICEADLQDFEGENLFSHI